MSTIEHRASFWPVLTLVFLYFVTLSADLLELKLGFLDVRISRFLAGLLFLILLFSNRFRLVSKRLFFCFLWIFSSFILSALFSCNILRSLSGCGAGVFAYVCFFLVPVNLMVLFDHKLILRLYFLSFVIVGMHAFAQFTLSFFGIADPFVTQTAGETFIARGQSWTYEPSFYALFATPFVVFINMRFLLSDKSDPEKMALWKVLGANMLLLISTSTGGFFSYFIFAFSCFFLTFFSFVKNHFFALRKKVAKFLLCFTLFFCGIGLFFMQMFLHTFYKFFYIGFLAHWSFMERWEKMVDAWEAFCQAPLFGVGLRSVEQYLYLKAHFDRSDVPLYEEVITRKTFAQYHLSNVFTEILACLGVYGLCAFIFLIVVLMHMFITHLKDEQLPLQERKTLFCFFVSIIVMLLCLQFNQGLFRNYIWAHMGISLGYLFKLDFLTNFYGISRENSPRTSSRSTAKIYQKPS